MVLHTFTKDYDYDDYSFGSNTDVLHLLLLMPQEIVLLIVLLSLSIKLMTKTQLSVVHQVTQQTIVLHYLLLHRLLMLNLLLLLVIIEPFHQPLTLNWASQEHKVVIITHGLEHMIMMISHLDHKLVPIP